MKEIRYRRLCIYIMLPVILLMCCIILCSRTNAESIGERVDDVVSYESVLVCKGDTLWSIAETNLDHPTNAEIIAYIDEIAAINGISSDNIHTGNYILLPRYKALT